MATHAGGAPLGRGYMADQAFYTRFAILLSLFIVLAFGGFALRGLGPPGPAALLVHAHAMLMLAWLGMYILQSSLISAGQVAVHRRTGWLSLLVALAAIFTGAATGINAVDSARVPPFFSDSFFLAVTIVGVAAFAAVVTLAIVKRRQVQWHRRLMIGSGILIAEPAFGRVVPLPLTGQSLGGLIILGLQLLLVGLLARHDHKVFSRLHPATLVIALALVVNHLLVELVHRLPAWQAMAAGIAAP